MWGSILFYKYNINRKNNLIRYNYDLDIKKNKKKIFKIKKNNKNKKIIKKKNYKKITFYGRTTQNNSSEPHKINFLNLC